MLRNLLRNVKWKITERLPLCGAQDFVENTETTMLARQVDVRDVARAHLLAAEVNF